MPDERNPMDALMDVFMVETNDFLTKLEEILIDNEKADGGVRRAMAEIFRIMHTIKSSAAMMSLDNISKLSHRVEDLFYFIRENNPQTLDDAELTDIVLSAVDFIKRNLDGMAKENPQPLIDRVTKFLDQLKGEKKSTPEPVPAPKVSISPPDVNQSLCVRFKPDCPMLGLRALEIMAKVRAMVDELHIAPADPMEREEAVRQDGLLLFIKTVRPTSEIIASIAKLPFVEHVDLAGDRRAMPQQSATPQTNEPVRQFVERRRDASTFGKAYANVEIAKLDNLVNLVGETLILHLELARDIERRDFAKADNTIIKFKKQILNLQEATLSTRMLPIKETFLQMNRLVRDICRKQGKDVDFVTSGEGTEVDRSIVDSISTPLMHILRNSIDHGIESAADREASGKSTRGRIELTAHTEGRNVVVTVTDDGKGFDTKRILEKALAIGLVSEQQATTMSDEDINGFVFLPGFSTNQEVTEYSGRGVGMDVVSDSLKKMNGRVIVQSKQNKGSKIILKIPLTLAIIDTIILRVGEETCAIPISYVDKILFMDEKDSIRNVNGEDMVLLNGECYKILNLFDFYTYASRTPYPDGTMILVGGDTKPYVIFASEIIDRQDVVVKPAPPLFQSVRGISGCTILGDGRISLILDTDELMASSIKKRSAHP